MIEAKSIDFFKDLTQMSYLEQFYDLHNDYDCLKINYKNNTLFLELKKIENNDIIFLGFYKASIENLVFFNEKSIDPLTINILYRGRIDKDGVLLDLSKDNQSYFYLEFEDQQSIEFWAEYIVIKSSIPKKL